jgi:hypothetical protein
MAILQKMQPETSGNDTGILRDYRVENSKRPVRILKLNKSLAAYRDMILFFSMEEMLPLLDQPYVLSSNSSRSYENAWINVGGQLMPKNQFDLLLTDIVSGALPTWRQIHQRYQEINASYKIEVTNFALAFLLRLQNVNSLSDLDWSILFTNYDRILSYLRDGLMNSRIKDFENPFRKMVYDDDEEMEAVLGDPSQDEVIVKTLQHLKERARWIELNRSKSLHTLFTST